MHKYLSRTIFSLEKYILVTSIPLLYIQTGGPTFIGNTLIIQWGADSLFCTSVDSIRRGLWSKEPKLKIIIYIAFLRFIPPCHSESSGKFQPA